MTKFISSNTIYNLAVKTTRVLNTTKQYELSCIRWTDGESNLDGDFSRLVCKTCEQTWHHLIENDENSEHKNVKIKCLPPDVNITFTRTKGDKEEIRRAKIELKSSKNKTMPGSTIRNLDINQPLIYCLRSTENEYVLRCSQYHIALGQSDTDLFQDRTPRPAINFNKMETTHEFKEIDKLAWIDHYANCAVNRLNNDSCTDSWQDRMVEQIKNKVINDFIQTTSIMNFCKLKQSLATLKDIVDKTTKSDNVEDLNSIFQQATI